MLALRVRLESNPTVANATERAVLEFMEAKLHGVEGELSFTDDDMAQWLEDFADKHTAAVMQVGAKASAGQTTPTAPRGRGRGRGSPAPAAGAAGTPASPAALGQAWRRQG